MFAHAGLSIPVPDSGWYTACIPLAMANGVYRPVSGTALYCISSDTIKQNMDEFEFPVQLL